MVEKSSGNSDEHRDEIAADVDQPVTHLFQVQLHGRELDNEHVERVARAIRAAARDELRAVDFQIEELTPLFKLRPGLGSRGESSNCGGACRSG